ncbi:hypothetical protein RhiirC2_787596 [Rhizophagus irregularis]|uniref:Uncharacterized protein n=1 Tax=Rhizophagus irregularis TaxID=588596 RepID=A0A2N1MRW4_9GLOM|nr:hypothetical protein RhiirC2_787596 [Rhizophagus irregularis]
MSRKVFDTITQEINIPVETIMLLLESSVEVAHKIYVDNMKRIGRENECRSSEKGKKAPIVEIPAITDDQAEKEKEMARDMFFYDILRYWKEEDIVANLSKIGKVFRIQVKQQYKYKFARTYSYDAAAGLKARQERDKWQLIRDLTEDEMKEVTNSLKNYTIAFAKVIKYHKNWKIIAYFIDSKIMELAVEASFKERDIMRIWSVRNFKTIFRGIETEGRKEINNEREVTVNSSTVNYTPRTPQNVGIKNKTVERLKSPINEEKVVDLIKRWRVRETSEESGADEDKKAELALMNLLRQDDIMSYECEKNDEKIKYEQYKDPENMEEDTESINQKLEKLGDIFKATSKKIEWETIRSHQRH